MAAVGTWPVSTAAPARASGGPQPLNMGLKPEHVNVWVKYTGFLDTILQVTKSGKGPSGRLLMESGVIPSPPLQPGSWEPLVIHPPLCWPVSLWACIFEEGRTLF